MELKKISNIQTGLMLARKRADGTQEGNKEYNLLTLKSLNSTGEISISESDVFLSKGPVEEKYLTKKEKGTPAWTLIFKRLSVACHTTLLNGLSGSSATIFSTIFLTPGNLISKWENLDNFKIYKPSLSRR